MRGKVGDSFVGILITVSVTIVFFVVCFLFLSRASGGVVVYEQAYAKQISLMIDKAKPGMEFEIDFSEGIEIAEKNRNKELSNSEKKSLIQIKNNIVAVSLTSGSYSSVFFTNYDLDYYFEGDILILSVTKGGKA